jgi:hypothetical protein
MGAALALVLLFSLLLIAAPIGLEATNHSIGAMASSIMIGSGVLLTVVCATLLIEKEAQVRIATAGALVQVYGKITANVYGTPEDVAKMGKHFADGMGLSQMVGGFLAGAGPETVEVAKRALTAVEGLTGAASERLKDGGKEKVEAKEPTP